MTGLLLKLFVKDYKTAEIPAVRSSVGRLAGIVGIVCNFLLFAAKLAAGILAGSVSVFADSANNLSDSAASVITLFGFRMAQRPADKDHPYGHARYEYLSGLAVAVFIISLGVELGVSSVKKIISQSTAEFSLFTFAVLGAAVLIKLWMFFFFRSLGRKIDSHTLKATATDCRNDVVATLAVLAGAGLQGLFGINADGYIGLAVCLFILYSGIKLVRETVSPLLGKRASAEQVEKLTALVTAHPEILGLHDLLVHDYGPDRCFASLHVELSAELDSLTSHDIIDGIERDALEQLNVHLVIHTDPIAAEDEEWNDMRRIVTRVVQEIDPRLSLHDLRIVRAEGLSRLIFDLDVPYSMSRRHGELKEAIEKRLAAEGKDYVLLIRFDGKEE